MGIQILVDSNILIYSLDDESPKSLEAKEFLENKSLKLIFSHQSLLETAKVITHKKFPNPYTPTKASLSLASITEQRVLIAPKDDTFKLAQRLILKHRLTANKIFDAYLAATAVSWGVSNIATDNERDFKKFSDIKVYNPFHQ